MNIVLYIIAFVVILIVSVLINSWEYGSTRNRLLEQIKNSYQEYNVTSETFHNNDYVYGTRFIATLVKKNDPNCRINVVNSNDTGIKEISL